MIPSTSTRERRDWTLLIFIIPIGILLMLAAGQFAIRLVPEWSVNAGMQSNLDPNSLPKQQSAPIQPVLPAILTPLGWFETFLTPGAGSDNQMVFPPFVVFEPSATPEVTLPPPTATQPSPTAPTSTPPTVVVTPPPATETNKPPVEEETPTPPTATPPTTTPPTATPTGIPSTPPSGYPELPPDVDIDVNNPPDGTPGSVFPGTYVVIDISGKPVTVSVTPDDMYDLIFYESEIGPGTIHLDHIIIGISKVNDGSYYEVFNWGDNYPDSNPDENTNVDFNTLPPDTTGSCTADECDNREIPTTELHTDTTNPSISTGILIDVDNAPGKPPEGDYGYIVIISPLGGDLDSAQVDAVVVEEQPLP